MDLREDLRVAAAREYPELRDPQDAATMRANFRMLTLIASMITGFGVTAISALVIPALAPYAFIIVVMVDAMLALYGYFRKF